MMNKAIGILLLLQPFSETSRALNGTPGSQLAACFQPYQFQLGDDGSNMRLAMSENDYTLHPYLSPGPIHPTLIPAITMDQLDNELRAGNGVFMFQDTERI
jgi:hypothetical protein